MTQLTDKHWAVEVPESWETAELHFQPSIDDMLNDREGFSELIMWYTSMQCGSPRQKMAIKLPVTGNWEFLFTTQGATEDQMIDLAGIPEQDVVHGWNLEIFNAWLKSKGCDTSKNYAILKNTNNGQ